MATRAVIIIEDINYCKVYKHWDGYKDATMPWLEAFNKRFAELRGKDPNYKLAQLLRDSAFNAVKYGLDTSTETGWGIIPYDADYGQEFTYTLHHDGTVTVKE